MGESVKATLQDDPGTEIPQEISGEDELLAKRVREGDATALESLVEKYQERIVNHLYRKTGNKDDAEELCQETFTRIWQFRSSYKPGRKFKTWLYTIATNTMHGLWKKDYNKVVKVPPDDPVLADVKDHGRDQEKAAEQPVPLEKSYCRKVTNVLPDDPILRGVRDHGHDQEKTAAQSESSEKLWEQINKLSPLEQQIIMLIDISELSYKETAEQLQIPLGTVKSRCSDARKSLHKVIMKNAAYLAELA